MNTMCGKEWDRKFLVSAFTKSFINGDWKKNREKILFDREVALLPATQSVVEEEIRKEKLTEEIKEIDKLMRQLNNNRLHLTNQLHNRTLNLQKTKFVRSCPDGDCRGFLSSQWKCGLCESFACPDCHVIVGKTKDTEHTCDPNELATAKLLDKDTKCCPKCSTGIFKIEGCDQMWCTQCRTAFSWKTGNIETRIHNPHFFEWQRRNGGEAPRNPDEIVCGREITHHMTGEISGILREKFMPKTKGGDLKDIALDLYTKASLVVRSMSHLINVQMPEYRVDDVENNLTLRVNYMRKKIDKDAFQISVQRANKKHEKKRDMRDILQLFVQTVTDIMYRFIDEIRKAPVNPNAEVVNKLNTILSEIQTIQEYSNQCLLDISNTYGSKPKQFKIHTHGTTVGIDVLISVEVIKQAKTRAKVVAKACIHDIHSRLAGQFYYR